MEVFALSAALVLFTTAAVCGVSLSRQHARANPIDPGTHPVTWVQPVTPAPVVPQSVTNTANYYIDTVNVYQAAAPVEEPQTIPAEVRRIRPAIGR